MKRNMKTEFVSSMDNLCFTPQQKAAMAQGLIAQMEEQTMRKHNFSSRKLVLIAAAAALLIATLTGAAAFTRWSKNAQNRYNPSEDVKQQAENSGLSVMLENKQEEGTVLSATSNGVTITAVQTLVDNFQAEIIFRIEGLELTEDQVPGTWPDITIDGQPDFYSMQNGGFYNGTTVNKDGEWVYISTGEPVQFRDDEYQSAILDFVADDGSLEYTHHITFDEADGRWLNKEIVVTFRSINAQSDKAGKDIPLVKGKWELRWTLTGTEDSVTVTPNAEIGNSGVILLEAVIGQKTVKARYQLSEDWEGWDELVEMPQSVLGVRMKDGSEYRCGSGTGGFEDREKMVYFTLFDIYDGILDISQVESLIFRDENGETVYIPIA